MASTIQVRVDDELKSKSYQLFKDLGTDTTSAIRMFLTQAVANNGFPFEIKRVEHNFYIENIFQGDKILLTIKNLMFLKIDIIMRILINICKI